MRVVIDGRAIAWAGVGRYIRNLVSELRQLGRSDEFVLAVSAADRELVRDVPHVLVGGSYYSWREQFLLGWKLRRLKADLWHFPHFNVPAWFDRPYVVTIHDTTRFFFPGQRRQGWWQQVMYEHVFARAVARARAVVTVSQTTADALRQLPVALPPLTVIPEAVGGSLRQPVTTEQRARVRQHYELSAPYLLFVGVWMHHKNIERLLRAFSLVRQRHPEFRLVITGQARPGYVPVPELARQLGVADAVSLPGNIPAADLPALYAEAQALVFPSLYEGFGLPLLEAAAHGVPVVASNVSSMPEVMGQAAIYVNPEDEVSVAGGILRVLEDRVYRAALVRVGCERVEAFSWAAAAEQTRHVYESVLN